MYKHNNNVDRNTQKQIFSKPQERKKKWKHDSGSKHIIIQDMYSFLFAKVLKQQNRKNCPHSLFLCSHTWLTGMEVWPDDDSSAPSHPPHGNLSCLSSKKPKMLP